MLRWAMVTYEKPNRSRRSCRVSQIESTLPSSACGWDAKSSSLTPKRDAIDAIDGTGLVVHGDEVRADLELDVVEPVARAGTHPRQLLLGLSGAGAGDARRPQTAGGVVEVDADDVRQPPGQRQDALATATDEDRGMRLLNRQRQSSEAVDMHVLAVDRQFVARPVGLQQFDDLTQALDADAGTIHRDAEAFVLGGHPAGAEADLETALGQQVERRHLLGQDDRLMEVDVEHSAPDAQVGGHRRGGRHCGDRRHVDGTVTRRLGDRAGPEVVIRGEQRAVAEGLGCGGRSPSTPCRRGLEGLGGEAESGAVRRKPWDPLEAAGVGFDDGTYSTTVAVTNEGRHRMDDDAIRRWTIEEFEDAHFEDEHIDPYVTLRRISSDPAVRQVTFPPNATLGLHSHPCDTLYVIQSGEFIVDGEGSYRPGELRWVQGRRGIRPGAGRCPMAPCC